MLRPEFDQLVLIESAKGGEADARLVFLNPDGS